MAKLPKLPSQFKSLKPFEWNPIKFFEAPKYG